MKILRHTTNWRASLKNALRTPQAYLFLLFFLFSFWLMFHTFSYNRSTSEIHIAYKLWSDFGAQIPLIRSFSYGDNLPNPLTHQYVQYPIYPGEPIRYHFIFFLVVGTLEKMRLPIDWALNIPSALGFFALLVCIYLLAHGLFKSKAVGVLSVLFFLFNGSLGFLRFFSLHPVSWQSIQDVFSAHDFPAFAPWGPGEVTAFWNLNIYTNQRHLAMAFAIVLGFIITVVRTTKLTARQQIRWGVIWGVVFGIFPFFHQPSLLIIALVLACYFFLFPEKRLYIFMTGVVSLALILPQILLDKTGAQSVAWYPGYTIHNEIYHLPVVQKLWQMIIFWWQNIGFHSILILIGCFFIPPKARRALIPIIPLFLIANLFKFSVEASANHKFFNFVMILGDMISAYVLVLLWIRVTTRFKPFIVRTAAFICISICIFFLTLSGIIDFAVVANDTKGTLVDIPRNETAQWIVTHTPKRAVFLNSSYLYHPASLAGRPIFLGWPYFAWSAGYPINRMPIMNSMYESRDPAALCTLLVKYNISYMTVENVKNDTNLPDIDLSYYLATYTPSFLSHAHDYAIISTQTICSKK